MSAADRERWGEPPAFAPGWDPQDDPDWIEANIQHVRERIQRGLPAPEGEDPFWAEAATILDREAAS